MKKMEELTKKSIAIITAPVTLLNESASSLNSLYRKDKSANTATAHHEFLVCSYKNNSERKNNNKEFITVCYKNCA